MYGLTNVRPKKFRKLPSAARFLRKKVSPYRFLDILFMSISQKFFDFCANSNRKITKLFNQVCVKKREHNAALKKRHHEGRFFGQKKT